MASEGSNVRLSLVGITGTTAEILYTIDTTGRYEDGYLIVFNENNTEVSRTSSFRAYGNSSGSQNVTGIASGHLYTVKFYSIDLGVYSTSTVEIDLRSGDPAYAVSSSSTATSVNIIVSPISSATMGADGAVVVESSNDGIKESISYKSTDSDATITIVGLGQNTTYTFSVEYYDPGLATMTVKTVIIDTAELDTKIVPKLYGEVENETQLVDRLYGEVSNEAQRVNRLYGSVNNQTKLIHLGVRHLDYRTLASVSGTIPAWGGVGIRATAFDGGILYSKITSDYPQFLPYSYCDAPIYRLKMVRKTTSYPATADLILQFGDANAIVAEETLESDVRAIYVFDDYGITVNGEGGEAGAASYINLTPTYT